VKHAWWAAALALLAAPAVAQEEKKQEEKKPEQISLEGKISKEVQKRKTKDGTEKEVTLYLLTDKEGKKTLLSNPKGKKNQTAFNWETYVDKNISVKGAGFQEATKGKKDPAGTRVTFSGAPTVKILDAPEKKDETKDPPK
jgi:hypothetical protein